jgi:hypothetical protein
MLKEETIFCPLPSGFKAPKFIYEKSKRIFYAYGTLRERDAKREKKGVLV